MMDPQAELEFENSKLSNPGKSGDSFADAVDQSGKKWSKKKGETDEELQERVLEK